MKDTTKDLLIRVAYRGAVLFVLYVLQVAVMPHLRVFGVAPLLLPLAVVGVALFEGPHWGGGFGLAAGVFMDIAHTNTTVLFLILLTALGLGVGALSAHLLSRGFPSFFLCSGATLVAIALLQLFNLLVFWREPPWALFRVAGLQTLYSMLFILPVYYLTRRLAVRR